MSKLSLKNRSAFTIIEVVIVLAIAALIIVIVLLAVAGLGRSQRTKAAQDYAARVVAETQQYLSDQQQGGVTPTAAEPVPATYFPAAERPGPLTAPANATTTPTLGVVEYQVGGTCGATGTTLTAGTNLTQIAVGYYSETAGAAACVHN